MYSKNYYQKHKIEIGKKNKKWREDYCDTLNLPTFGMSNGSGVRNHLLVPKKHSYSLKLLLPGLTEGVIKKVFKEFYHPND